MGVDPDFRCQEDHLQDFFFHLIFGSCYLILSKAKFKIAGRTNAALATHTVDISESLQRP